VNDADAVLESAADDDAARKEAALDRTAVDTCDDGCWRCICWSCACTRAPLRNGGTALNEPATVDSCAAEGACDTMPVYDPTEKDSPRLGDNDDIPMEGAVAAAAAAIVATEMNGAPTVGRPQGR